MVWEGCVANANNVMRASIATRRFAPRVMEHPRGHWSVWLKGLKNIEKGAPRRLITLPSTAVLDTAVQPVEATVGCVLFSERRVGWMCTVSRMEFSSIYNVSRLVRRWQHDFFRTNCQPYKNAHLC